MTVEMENDPKLAGFFGLLKELGSKAAYVGVLASGKANESHGSSDGEEPVTNVKVATWMEFGTEDEEGNEIVPERSFLRETLRLTKDEVQKAVAKRIRLALLGKLSPDAVYERTGQQVVSLCQEHIEQGINPSLKHREGIPLIDSGVLKSAITYEVR